MKEPRGYDPRAAGADCDRCPLKDTVAVPPDPGRGPGRVKLIVIGEAPGNFEISRGIPFIGPSGKLLDRRLEENGVSRSDVWSTNAAMCLPYNDIDKVKQRAVACCAPRLARELAELDPEKKLPVLALGKWAAFSLLGISKIVAHRGFVWRAPSITKQRLRAAERSKEKARAVVSKERTANRVNLLSAMASYEGRVIIPSIHPAFVLRSETWGPVMKLDIARASRIATGTAAPDLLDEGAYVALDGNDPQQLLGALAVLGDVVAVDIESKPSDEDLKAKRKYPDPMTCKILCVGLSDADPRIPREKWNTFVLHPRRFSRVHGGVLKALFKARTAVFHNGKAFDEIALGRHGASFPRSEDTLIAHHTFASHLPQSLGHVASVFAPFCGPWKANHQAGGALAERGTSPWESEGEELARYCASDVRIDCYVWHEMKVDLFREKDVYERDMAVASLCQEMQVVGLGVDVARRQQLSLQLQRRAAALLGEIRSLVKDRDFHPGRPADMRKVLFGRFKAPCFKLTESGFRSTGKEVLETLRGSSETNYGKLADLTLRWRSAMKADSTFLTAPMGPDERLHSSWRSFGAATGRPSSREPNLLNLPRFALVECVTCGRTNKKDVRVCKVCGGKTRPAWESQIRSIYVSRPGHVYVYYDLKTAEMYCSAHLSNDPEFIKACLTGDIHTENACLLFPEKADLIRADPKGAGASFRDMAKTAGFAVNYGAAAVTVWKNMRANGFPVELQQVELMLDRMRSRYRVYYQWVQANIEEVQRCGYMRTALLKRIRWFGRFPKIEELMSNPIQSLVADIMGERLVETNEKKPAKWKAPLVFYGYDSAAYETPRQHAEQLLQLLNEVWARPVTLDNGVTWRQPIDPKIVERLSEI